MSQSLSQVLSQQMRMEQRLTPQLIQSMNILQLPVTDLEALIDEEMEKNPALELVEDADPSSDGHTAEQTERNDSLPSIPRIPATDGTVENRTDETSPSFQRLEQLSRQYDMDFEDAGYKRSVARDSERDAKLDALANAADRTITLQDHLTSQWSLMDVDPEIRRAGEAIIQHLDDDGYLRIELDDIASRLSPPPSSDVMHKALREVQSLDPPGVGARNVRECLLLQLDALPGDNCIERAIIENHLDSAARNLLPAIAKATGYRVEEISAALNVIRTTLHPHPGRLVSRRSEPPVRPDVIVEYSGSGGELEVRLARGNGPRLRVSPQYLHMARSRDTDKSAREFARRGVEAASALIDAIEFRRNRLLDVARLIADRQKEFFDLGPHGLRPLRMSEVAEELGCDPSTVSRTVADKYVQTPRGIYPLRYFFLGGTETQSGEVTSWESIRDRVVQIIRGEDPYHPLTDDQIVDLLKKEGIDISRRTVAKYRQVLDIPPARRRRKY